MYIYLSRTGFPLPVSAPMIGKSGEQWAQRFEILRGCLKNLTQASLDS